MKPNHAASVARGHRLPMRQLLTFSAGMLFLSAALMAQTTSVTAPANRGNNSSAGGPNESSKMTQTGGRSSHAAAIDAGTERSAVSYWPTWITTARCVSTNFDARIDFVDSKNVPCNVAGQAI